MKFSTNNEQKAIVLAHYLPQFHSIPENDSWWGEGFTEWTNVKKARPLFFGHAQPVNPGQLGYYDLLNPEVRMQQARLAKNHGITGFAYWHYWFGNGKRLLEKPFHKVLENKKPDLPFCLSWANESWTGIWHGLKNKILMEQKYPGEEDYTNHFNHVLTAFKDKRYIKIENKPLFIVYLPHLLPDAAAFTKLWNRLAKENGFDGMYFIGIHYAGWEHEKDGFEGKSVHPLHQYVGMFEQSGTRIRVNKLRNILFGKLKHTYRYKDLVRNYDKEWLKADGCIPSLLPNWDNTPRSEKRGWIIQGSSPKLFGEHFTDVLSSIIDNKSNPHNIVLLKSWNEWAEGNYLEPDSRWGTGYLRAIDEARKNIGVNTLYEGS